MAEQKTRPTAASAQAYIDAITDAGRRRDCLDLAAMMGRITGEKPAMWGPSIVGFGSYHYTYDSGHEGDACVTGFSSRKDAISVYLVASGPDQEKLLARLGKHKMGKACLYIKRMSDIDPKVLEELIAGSVGEVRRRYG
jgi:Domain of unknown function (DU1801)